MSGSAVTAKLPLLRILRTENTSIFLTCANINPIWVHATVKKKKDEDGTEELQTGRKYLLTIGRTDKLFGDTPNDLVNGCICGDDGGGPKAFNVF